MKLTPSSPSARLRPRCRSLRTVFALGLLSLAAPLLPAAGFPTPLTSRQVFAHCMISQRPFNSYSLTSLKAELRMAYADGTGLDGFALNIFGAGDDDWVGNMFLALDQMRKSGVPTDVAIAQNFHLYLKFSGSNFAKSDIISIVNTHKGHQNYHLVEGLPLVETYNTKTLGPVDWLEVIDQTGSYFIPGIGFDDADTHVTDPYQDIAARLNKIEAGSSWLTVADGMCYFGAAAAPYWPNTSYSGLPTDTTYGYLAIDPATWQSSRLMTGQVFQDIVRYNNSKRFIGTVSPHYWTMYKPQLNPDNYYEYLGPIGLVKQWNQLINPLNQHGGSRAISVPDMVELITWNDFGESSHFVPIGKAALANIHRPSGISQDPSLRFYEHIGYWELNKYYMQWYRDLSQPAIAVDKIVYAYRPVLTNPANAKGAVSTPAENKVWFHGYGNGVAPDNIHFVLLLRPPTAGESNTVKLTVDVNGTNVLTQTYTPSTQQIKLLSSSAVTSAAVGHAPHIVLQRQKTDGTFKTICDIYGSEPFASPGALGNYQYYCDYTAGSN